MTERLVDVGDHVAAGDVLARIDPAQQQADVAASDAAVRSAEAQLRQTTSAFDRQKALLAQGFTTRSAYDSAEEAQRTAQGSLDAARAQLQTSRETLSYTELKADAPGVVTARNIEVGQVTQIDRLGTVKGKFTQSRTFVDGTGLAGLISLRAMGRK